jgi:hypothetical protein
MYSQFVFSSSRKNSAYNLILILYNLLEEKPLQLIGIVKEVRMVQKNRPGRLGSEKYPI